MDKILELQEARTKHVHFDKIAMEELISAQFHDVFCSEVYRRFNEGEDFPFVLDKSGLSVLTATPDEQIITPNSLKKRVLLSKHNPTLAGHPGGRKLYARIRLHFYWMALPTDYYETVRNLSLIHI